MKFDIVYRLQNPPFGTETSERNLMSAAATEIERLRDALLEIAGHLGAAQIQRAPSDDKIIAEHIDAALVIAQRARLLSSTHESN